MKKILVLAALALLGIVFAAQAGPLVAPHRVHNPIKWRTHRAAYTAYINAGSDGVGISSFVDSVTCANTAGPDTTETISTEGWASQDAADSAYARLTVSCQAATYSVDSVYVAAQVSADNVVWAYAGSTKNTAQTGFTTYRYNGNSFGSLNQSVSTAHLFTFLFGTSGVNGTISRSSADFTNLYSFPYVRFIVFLPSGASIAGVSPTRTATISYLSADQDLNR